MFSAARRMARRLLRAYPRLVTDTLLYAIVIYGVGCIVPTPLDPQPLQTNYAPVLLPLKCMPPFGDIAVSSSNQLIELSITVNDPDDTLPGNQDDFHARLFYPDQMNPGKLFYPGNEEIPLTPENAADPMNMDRTGSWQPQAFCLGKSGTQLIYVIAADRPFQLNDPTTVVNGGLSDQNHWELKCP
jgi:hypothetical protein